MIELTQRSKPYQIALPYGSVVTLEPLSTPGMATAQAVARRSMEAIERQSREHTEADLPVDGLQIDPNELEQRRQQPVVIPLRATAMRGPSFRVGPQSAVLRYRRNLDPVFGSST